MSAVIVVTAGMTLAQALEAQERPVEGRCPMTTLIPLSRGLSAIVDEADAPIVAPYRWCAVPDRTTWYASRHLRLADGGRTSQRMHQLITGFALTDHINGNGLDNRRANLRPATNAQNQHNQRKSRGISQYKGVTWHKGNKRWMATIYVNNRPHHLGYFDDEAAAGLAYDEAARGHFGGFAAVNFPKPGERGCRHEVAS